MIRRFSPILRVAIIAGMSLAAFPAYGQLNAFNETREKGIAAMKAGNWEEAQKIFQGFTDDFKGRELQVFGPQFGWFLYHRGITELRLKQFDAAAESFKTSYEKFPNDLEGAKTKNIYHSQSLLKWGDAELNRGDFKKAVELYNKFIQLPKKGKFNRGKYYTNLAQAYLSLDQPKIKEGIEAMESALTNRVNWGIPPRDIFLSLRVLVENAIKVNDEQVIIDFILKHRSKLKFSDRDLVSFGPIITSLVGQATNADMNKAALVLLGIAPSTKNAIAEIEMQIESLGPAKQIKDVEARKIVSKERLVAQLDKLSKDYALGKSFDPVLRQITAIVFERMGNRTAAYASYKDLHESFPKSKDKTKNLFHLVRTAAALGKMGEAEEYGNLYAKLYPNGENINDVQGLTINSLLSKGQYKKAIEVGLKTLDKLEKPSKEHDGVSAAVATATYYLGDFQTALERLNDYTKTYPKGERITAILFFQASSLSRLGKYAEAVTKLKAFIKDNPDPASNTFYAQAHADLANALYATFKYDEALEVIGSLEKVDNASPMFAGALNIKGNIQQIKKDHAGARGTYESALKIAEDGDNSGYAGEAIGALIALFADGTKLEIPEADATKQIVSLYDRFYEKHSKGSPYGARIATTALPAMISAGRTDDALKRMQAIIVDIAQQSRQVGIEEAIEAYTAAYLETKSPEELKTHFYNFPDLREDDKATRALLRIAIVGVYERIGRKADKDGDKNAKIKADAATKVIFQELKTDFNPADLSNLILVKLGDYLRENTSVREEAIPYYEQALSRNDKTMKYEAHFGLGDILLSSKDQKKIDRGIKELLKTFKEASVKDQASLKEAALYRVISHFVSKENWKKVNEFAKTYRENEKPRFTKNSAEVLYAYAQSFDKMGNEKDALAQYTRLFGPFAGRIELAAPSYMRFLEILWKRNNPGKTGENVDLNHSSNFGDRQGATYAIEIWLEATGNQKENFTPEGLQLWDQLKKMVDEYIQKDPEVRSLKQIREDRGE